MCIIAGHAVHHVTHAREAVGRFGLSPFLPGQLQQLAHQPAGAIHRYSDALQGMIAHGRVRGATGHFGLGFESSQRRLELVRGIGHKIALRTSGPLKSGEQVVHCLHQRPQFFGHGVDGEWLKGLWRTQLDCAGNTTERCKATPDTKPKQHSERNEPSRCGQQQAQHQIVDQMLADRQAVANHDPDATRRVNMCIDAPLFISDPAT